MPGDCPAEDRLLVLAPRGRDAQVIEQVLQRNGADCVICADFPALLDEMTIPAGAALIAEEALHGVEIEPLTKWLEQQASWSDFPFVVLVSQRAAQTGSTVRSALKSLGNVVLLERPINAETLRSAAASVLRARRRQYQARSALEARVRSEEELRIALQAGRLGTWELDLPDRLLRASTRFKQTFGLEESTPFNYADLLAATHPDDRARYEKVLERSVAAVADFDIEYRVYWVDGSVHWVHQRGKVYADKTGRPTKVVGVSQDVTERRVAELRLRDSQEALLHLNATLESRIESRTAELAKANDRLMREMTERERAQMTLVQNQKMEALGHLTSGISHDFNNLLSVIQGNADLVYYLTEDERLKRMANTIRKASQQGAKLTGQLLAFSRGQRLDLKAIDLNKALDGVRDLLTASLGSNIRVEFDFQPDVPPVRADLNQIELAVLNLVINAKDAMHDGGIITIRTSVRPAGAELAHGQHYAVVSVIDSGEGIDPHILDKVFDPFFTTKPLGKGTGLGLSQVYGIAQQSGGDARISSQLGKGTTVEIWLPFADAGSTVEPALHDEKRKQLSRQNAMILVVEDDSRVRRFIVEGLEILGYQVTQAEDGPAGLAKAATLRPDLLITDFLMPGMTGAELIQHIHVRHPDLPVIIATGYADMEAIKELVNIDTVLLKPFQWNDLAYRVERVLATARRGTHQA